MNAAGWETLRRILPQLARAVAGWAALADTTGRARLVVDDQGNRAQKHEGAVLLGGGPAAPDSVACPWDGAVRFGVVPLGDGFLCLDAGGFGRRVRERFRKALPLIAKVAGGEAVLFDAVGTRVHSVDSDGNVNASYTGKVSGLARQSMLAGKPMLGDSTYIVGAKAVRIPIGDDFGIGFNNNDSVAQRQKLIDSIYELQSAEADFSDIVGGVVEMDRIKREARDAAESDRPVLLVGAKGTGKRMFAQAMHNADGGRSRPFITVNCGAFEQELLEGAVFGYADAVIRGVMRGRHPGAIVLAGGGTLYLTNIDQMDLRLQAKLAETLSTGRFLPVGDTVPVAMNARVIASTDKNIEAMAKVGRFDARLQRLLEKEAILLPSLSAIPGIVPELAQAFLKQLNLQYGTRVEEIDPEVADILERQAWPGNAGELRAFLRTAVSGMDDSPVLKKGHLPLGLAAPTGDSGDGSEDDSVYGQLVRDYEAQIIRHALLVNGGSRLKTAEHLGLSKSSLWRKMKKLNIE